MFDSTRNVPETQAPRGNSKTYLKFGSASGDPGLPQREKIMRIIIDSCLWKAPTHQKGFSCW